MKTVYRWDPMPAETQLCLLPKPISREITQALALPPFIQYIPRGAQATRFSDPCEESVLIVDDTHL